MKLVEEYMIMIMPSFLRLASFTSSGSIHLLLFFNFPVDPALFSVHVRGSEYVPLLGSDDQSFSFLGVGDFES